MQRAIGFLVPLLAWGTLYAEAPSKEDCAKLLTGFRSRVAEFRKKERRYLHKMKCSLDAWKNYLREREALLKVGGIGRKAARAALRDLDARNADLRKRVDQCQRKRQELEDIIKTYNADLGRHQTKLDACRIVIPPIPQAYTRDYPRLSS
jgi:chromosome segregation ATPase